MILSSETFSEPIFHVIGDGNYAAVLERFPYATPTFHIKKLPTNGESMWKVTVDYDINFTENMRQRTDVLQFMIEAQAFIDTTNISTVIDTVTRLLKHWARKFPRGIPDSIL